MSTLRIPMAASIVLFALVGARTSFADEPAPQRPGAPQTSEAPRTEQEPRGVTQQPVRQPPVGTTQTTAAPYAPYVSGGDRYAERTVERRPNRSLLSTGTGIFVLSYGSSVVAAAMSDRDADKRLFIPVAGPWMDLSDRGCGPENPCGANEDVARAMIITSGIVQGAGVLMALGSLVIPETTSVQERSTAAKATVKILPVSFGAGAGVGAVGRF